MKRTYGIAEANDIAKSLEIDFETSGFDLEQFLAGLDVEAEHGAVDPATDVTSDDPLTTAKIALAHLKELPDYYTRLKSMETDAGLSPGITPSATGGSRKRRVGKWSLIGLALLVLGTIAALLIRRVRARSG